MNWWQPPTIYILIAIIVILSIPVFILRKRIWAEIRRWQPSEFSILGIKITRKPDGEVEKKAALPSSATKMDLATSLPSKRYSRLIGREDETHSILASLRNPQAKSLIAVVGMGGIGKSAVTREIVDQAIQSNTFSASLWITAKLQSLDKLDELSTEEFVSYETVLKKVTSWIGAGSDFQKKNDLAKFEAEVHNAFLATPVLIVLDNLETSVDQSEIAEKFARLLHGTLSRALLTSREDFGKLGNLVETHLLKGLDVASSVQLLQEVARKQGVERILNANQTALKKIARAVGGMPLALQLSAGLLNSIDISVLLGDLEAIQSQEMRGLYEYLFAHAWRSLTDEQKDMLVAISSFDENEGVRSRNLQAAQVVKEDQFVDVIQALTAASLIEVSGSVNSTRYNLHPLTMNFIRSQTS